ncbi:hypothetical protein RF55_12298 [Lasius niger]|uniref:Uncharacterized protein n=1 Tax=Lasius niger TaxID=67767 RepID=A0A0J7KDH7_LASNI|nr:hypothetical protein RF55_12298 [Lasius niger]
MPGSDNICERKKIARKIAKTSESICKKHRTLKTGKIDDDIAVKTHFKPIIEPLQKIVDNSSPIAVKNELESNVDAKIKTLPIKRYEEEEDTSPKKRKRSNADRSSTPIGPTSDLSDASLDEPPITSTLSATTKIVQPTIPESLANENVFETTGNSLETSVRNVLQTPESQEMLQEHLGSLGQKYMGTLLGDNKKNEIDHVYGINFDKDKMLLGNKRFDIDKDDSIIIDKIEPKKKKSGKGVFMPPAMTLTDNKIDYVHWDDPNELVDRLRFLDASRRAGHDAHDNEILSIIEELREVDIIIN